MNKYRAWDKEKKFMITELFVSSDGDVYDFAEVKYATPHIEIALLNDRILMQFTGLKDKNGVKIFEGDAVKSKERSDGPTRLFIVSKDKYKTGFKPFVDVGVGFCRELCKVIGNVFEDGDILNDSENTKRN